MPLWICLGRHCSPPATVVDLSTNRKAKCQDEKAPLGNRRDQRTAFKSARRRAPVTVDVVPVVTLLARVDYAVSTYPYAGIVIFVASPPGTWISTRFTETTHAGFHPVAEQPVIAIVGHDAFQAQVGSLITRPRETRIARRAAIVHCVAELCTVAEQTVVRAVRIVRRELAVEQRVARIVGTVHTVVALVVHRDVLAIEARIAQIVRTTHGVVAGKIVWYMIAHT